MRLRPTAQAAILLLLGRQLRGDDAALTAHAANSRSARMMSAINEESAAEFPVPKLRATSARVSAPDTRGALARRYGDKVMRYRSGKDDPKQWASAYADLGEQLYKTPTTDSAAALMELCLRHPDELTRVAAADLVQPFGHARSRGVEAATTSQQNLTGAVMRLPGAVRLFACRFLWRGLHVKRAGQALISALGDADEDLRVIAGMFLVRAGLRSVPLLAEALRQRRQLSLVVQIIADIDAREFEPDLRRLTDDPDPHISQAARRALQQLTGAHT